MVLIDKLESGWIPKSGLYLFPVLIIIFGSVYFYDESVYRSLVREDGVVEWLTFTFLIVSGVISLTIASRLRTKHRYFHWFFVLFFGFNLLAGFEEISWGQRIFDVETTGVFHKYSDQNEMNLHNTFQGMFHIKTKHIALIVLFIYGVILPGLWKNREYQMGHPLFRQLIIPPLFLRGGFFIGALLMLDFQTGHEEELGELLFSVCFVIMMLWNLQLMKRGYFRANTYLSIPNRIPSLSE